MARRARRVLVIVLAGLAALVAIAAGFQLYESEPMDDMRERADVVQLPKDFVLVNESYSPGAMGFFGAVPHLQRVYHASWSSLCDSLRELAGRVGPATALAPISKPYADQMCNASASLKTGWMGRIRNYRHYEVWFIAWRPGLSTGPLFETARGFLVLYPRQEPGPGAKIVIPEDRARVEVELIARRGW